MLRPAATVAPAPARRLRPRARWLAPLLALACDLSNEGRSPPVDGIFFPSGLLLDPRAAPGEPARYLFVANGNNDLSYNSGTLAAIDLDAFFASWSIPGTYAVDPYCRDDVEPATQSVWDHPRCIGEVGSGVTPVAPCRRLSLLPQVVECDETPFIGPLRRLEGQGAQEFGVGDDSVVALGDFATLLTSSCEDEQPSADGRCASPRIWVPVRGDPSITWIDVHGAPDEPPVLDCGQNQPNPDKRGAIDPRCDHAHRLTHLRNDADLGDVPREPFNVLISPSHRYGYVAHSDGGKLSLIALDGVGDGVPAVVDTPGVFGNSFGFGGGFGLAERPCDADGRPPSITLDCVRPLVYASNRYQPLLVSFTAQGIELDPEDPTHSCAGPDEVGEHGKIACDPRIRSEQTIFPGGLDPSASSSAPVLGDIAFSDASGDQLLVVQTGPGALLRINTAIGPSGEPFDTPSGPPLELCEEPTRMKLFEDGGKRFALISCFRAALIYIVDLQGFRVVDAIVAGTGPYELVVDQPRRLLYVANNLEGSISVIDLAGDRPTRFREIARIGLQEPFSR